MPKLGSFSTKKLILPSSTKDDEAYVVIRTNLLAGDIISPDTEDKKQAAFEMISRIITEWNFTDETGKIAAINVENIKKLQLEDLMMIEEEVNVPTKAIDDLKKKGLLQS